MIDPIEYAFTYIWRIPEEVLFHAFLPKDIGNQLQVKKTIESKILEEIINGIVLKDVNLVAGKIRYIPINSTYCEKVSYEDSNLSSSVVGTFGIYRIPPEARDYAHIGSVVSVHYPIRSFAATNPYGSYSCPWQLIDRLGKESVRSRTNSNTPPMPIAEVLQGDLIRLIPSQFAHIDWVIAAKLMFSKEMLNLNNSQVTWFAKMCRYATEMKIRQKLRIKVDKAYIEGGAEIGAFKEIIDDFSDSEEKYEEAKVKFQGSGYLDTRTKMVMLSRMI